MDRLLRWVVAWTVTGVVCVAVTWAAGAVLLSGWISSEETRWVISSGLGVAATALTALWAYGFATRGSTDTPGMSVTAPGKASIAVGGDISGTASTSGSGVLGRSSAGANPVTPAGGSAEVTASGQNSIAVGGSISGSAWTGDAAESPET